MSSVAYDQADVAFRTARSEYIERGSIDFRVLVYKDGELLSEFFTTSTHLLDYHGHAQIDWALQFVDQADYIIFVGMTETNENQYLQVVHHSKEGQWFFTLDKRQLPTILQEEDTVSVSKLFWRKCKTRYDDCIQAGSSDIEPVGKDYLWSPMICWVPYNLNAGLPKAFQNVFFIGENS